MNDRVDVDAPAAPPPGAAAPDTSGGAASPEPSSSRRQFFVPGMDRFSGIYLIVIMVIIFSVWMPDTFATSTNFRVIAQSQAIAGLLALAAVLSLASGVFDLSVAANMTFAISFVGVLQADHGMNAALAAVLTLAAGAAIGAANAVVVTVIKVDPVIGTLGMSSILAAMAYWISQGRTIIDGISPTFVTWGTRSFFGIPITVYYLAVLTLMLWYVLEHTPFGRYLYALGSNPVATRLAGVRVVRLQWIALITSGTIAALAGVVLTMSIGSSSFGAGNSYLLPAFAAAFLGSTQIKPGRFNVLGTIVAIYLLAIGVKGLQLHFPASPWIKNLFEGCALIVAVGLAARAERKQRT